LLLTLFSSLLLP
jgi:hypothetical protein